MQRGHLGRRGQDHRHTAIAGPRITEQHRARGADGFGQSGQDAPLDRRNEARRRRRACHARSVISGRRRRPRNAAKRGLDHQPIARQTVVIIFWTGVLAIVQAAARVRPSRARGAAGFGVAQPCRPDNLRSPGCLPAFQARSSCCWWLMRPIARRDLTHPILIVPTGARSGRMLIRILGRSATWDGPLETGRKVEVLKGVRRTAIRIGSPGEVPPRPIRHR